jgi:hypothetical protein
VTKNTKLFEAVLSSLLYDRWPKDDAGKPQPSADVDADKVLRFKALADDVNEAMPFDWSTLSDWFTLEAAKWRPTLEPHAHPSPPNANWNDSVKKLREAIDAADEKDDPEAQRGFLRALIAIYGANKP